MAIGCAFGKASCLGPCRRPGADPRLALTRNAKNYLGSLWRPIAPGYNEMLARAASRVSREINRNGGVGGYRAAAADKIAWSRPGWRCMVDCGRLSLEGWSSTGRSSRLQAAQDMKKLER